jgi:hypothetical protein
MSAESNSTEFWVRFAIASLAAWRITHLLAHEDGPFDVIYRLRALGGAGFWGRLLDCFYCLSLWIAAPLTPLVTTRDATDALLVWVALSGAACLLERATAPRIQLERPPAGFDEQPVRESVLRED